MDISLLQIRPADRAILEATAGGEFGESPPVLVWAVNDGFMVMANVFGQIEAQRAMAYGFSDEFVSLMHQAREAGCTFAFFSSFGDFDDRLPWFAIELGVNNSPFVPPLISTLHITPEEFHLLGQCCDEEIAISIPVVGRDDRGFALSLGNWNDDVKKEFKGAGFSDSFLAMCDFLRARGLPCLILDHNGEAVLGLDTFVWNLDS